MDLCGKIGFFSLSLLLAGIGWSGETINTLTSQEKSEGWQLLWDGKTSEGWRSRNGNRFPAKGWKIEGGVLTVLPRRAGGGGGDIITCRTYTNFVLKVDFRMTPGANSGIKYLFNPRNFRGTTLEYQILDDKHPDAKGGRNGNRRVASFYDVMPAVGAQAKPIGEWNTAMIQCRGKKVEHWLNGRKVLSFERGSAAFRQAVRRSKFGNFRGWGEQASGHILLQDHSDQVSYRNIKIKVLDD